MWSLYKAEIGLFLDPAELEPKWLESQAGIATVLALVQIVSYLTGGPPWCPGADTRVVGISGTGRECASVCQRLITEWGFAGEDLVRLEGGFAAYQAAIGQ